MQITHNSTQHKRRGGGKTAGVLKKKGRTGRPQFKRRAAQKNEKVLSRLICEVKGKKGGWNFALERGKKSRGYIKGNRLTDLRKFSLDGRGKRKAVRTKKSITDEIRRGIQ